MMRAGLNIAIVGIWLGFASTAAQAQNQFVTPDGQRSVFGTAPMCLNGSGQAVPWFSAAGAWQCAAGVLPVGGGQIATPNVTIANGASLSGAVDLGTARLFAIQMPAAWTAASLTFQASSDCIAYANLFNDAGTEVAATVAASQYIVTASPAAWLGIRCLKVRSGTSGTPVNQGADRILTIVAVP